MATTTEFGNPNTDLWASYVEVGDGDSTVRSSIHKTACDYFTLSSSILHCTSSGLVCVQIITSQGVIRSFLTRCGINVPIMNNWKNWKRQPPTDCASTGCISENTDYCYLDMHYQYKCSCRTASNFDPYTFTGNFCEHQQKQEHSCTENLQTDVNIVDVDSNILDRGCGCTDDMSSCSFNSMDACGDLCEHRCILKRMSEAPSSQSLKTSDRQVAACQCDPSFEGELCFRRQCVEMPCQNGGTCEKHPLAGIKCFCDIGYTGEFCEIQVGLCTETSCENGGTCYNLDPLSTFCLCHNGYAGDRCERMLDLGCFNGGMQKWDGSCECSLPWEGYYCTLLKDPMPLEVCGCSDGATCVFDVNEGVVHTSCVCPENYVGNFCEIPQRLPCEGYCFNGGTCSDEEDVPVCQCSLQFTGKQCEKAVNDNSYNIKISPSTQLLFFYITDVNSVFSVCLWIRATPKRTVQNPEMPIFEMDFGSEKLRVTTAKISIKGQSVPALNLRMQLWQQFCIRCTDFKCMTFVNGASEGIDLIGTFSFSLSTLVIAPAVEDDEEMLDAEISRFSIYDRAITDQEAAEFAFECASTVGIDELADNLWWDILDSVPRSALISPGLCESSNCWPGLCEEKIDKSPPIATVCPSDIFVDSSRPIAIYWNEPVFEDGHSVTEINSNYRSGDIFVWGEHHVVYTATDASTNTGRCEFDIYLAPNVCAKPQKPYQGDVFYNNTFDGESGSFSMANVQCEDERFPQDGPMFYVCDYMGQWRRSYYSPEVNLPACGKVTEPTQPKNGTMYECPAEAPFQFEKNEAILCAEVPPGYYYNHRSQARFICPIDQYQDKSNQPKCEYCPNGTITVSEGATKRSDCYQNCTPGYWCNYDTGLGEDGTFDHCCQPCEKGRFAPENGSLQCLYCENGMTTENEGTINEDDCYWPCTVGQEVDDVTRECRECDRGMYKDSDRPGQCIKCNDGITTSEVGSKSSSECSVLFCPRDTYVNPNKKGSLNPYSFVLSDFCLPCEKGMMQSQPNSTSCVKCPDTPDMNNELPSTCRMQNECSPLLPNYCGDEMKCLKWDDYNYYHCVEDHSEQHNESEALTWWQIALIATGCLGLAGVIAVTIIVGMRCYNEKNKETSEAVTESISEGRRTTNDNFVATVPDSDMNIFASQSET